MDNQKIILLFIGLLAAVLISCTPTQHNTPPISLIRIGVSTPLSGPASQTVGSWTRNGLAIAINHLSPEARKNIEILYEDDQCNPIQGLTVARKFVELENISFVIGPVCGSVFESTTAYYDDHRVLRIHTTGAMESYKTKGEYKFVMGGYVEDWMAALSSHASKAGIKTIDIIYLDDDYGRENLQQFKKHFQGYIIHEESFVHGTVDFRTQLTKIKQYPADGVLIIAYGPYLTNALKQMNELGIQGKRMSLTNTRDPEIIKAAGNLTAGLIFPSPLDKSTSDIKLQFEAEYLQQFNASNEITAASAFDSLSILLGAIEQCGQDVPCVKEKLHEATYSGASGLFRFDGHGVAAREVVVMTVKNGEFVKIT